MKAQSLTIPQSFLLPEGQKNWLKCSKS